MAFSSAKHCQKVQMRKSRFISWLPVYFLLVMSVLAIVRSMAVDDGQPTTVSDAAGPGAFKSDVQFLRIPQGPQREKRSGEISCGKNLASLLSMVCHGRYNTRETGRRRRRRFANLDEDFHSAGFGQKIPAKLQEEEEGLGELNEVFANQWTKSAPIILHRRHEPTGRIGAYSQCCLKQCTQREMAEYCHPEIRKTYYSNLFKT